MLKRFILLAVVAAITQSLPAQAPVESASRPPHPAAAAETPKPVMVRVSLETAAGPILLELEAERAPITTRNFLRYVDQKSARF